MIERFADTSGWAPWADRTLEFHELALQEFDLVWDQQRQIITTEPVLAELTALLTRPMRMPKVKQIELIMAIRHDPLVKIFSLDESRSKHPGNYGVLVLINSGLLWTVAVS
ncbi:MAG: hypothetical protein QM703_15390 [Gemmatales bacterium]